MNYKIDQCFTHWFIPVKFHLAQPKCCHSRSLAPRWETMWSALSTRAKVYIILIHDIGLGVTQSLDKICN